MNIGNIDMLGGYLGSEEVIKCYQGNTVVWEQSSGSPIDYSTMPLTFEILSDGYISWAKRNSGTWTVTIEYQINNGEWVSLTNTSTGGTRIPVVTGDEVHFRGNNAAYSGNYPNFFSGTTCQFNLKGNIMSMINSTNFSGLTAFTSGYTFEGLFRNTPVISAEHLLLPATTLTNNCYQAMFWDCKSLTTAPELPAKTLTTNCYWYMFAGCSNLNYIKCMATNISATQSTDNWTQGVAASGTFVKASSMNDWTIGINGIPSGWTIENEGEIDYSTIPLTFEITGDGNIKWKSSNSTYTKTIEYSKNGDSWTSITSSTAGVTIPVVSGDTVQFRGDNTALGENGGSSFSGTTCQFNVKGNIISLLNSTGYTEITSLSNAYALNNMFITCTGLTSAEHLVLPILTFNERAAYASMFEGCTSLTTAPSILPATTLGRSCYWKMFYGCTSLTTAPELPATTLTTYAYLNMFDGCTNLNYVKCLAETGNSTANCENWLRNVASTGTFVTPSTTSWSTGTAGIPSGWTRVNSD